MRVVVTGSSGRIGSAICRALGSVCEIVGADNRPSSATPFVGDISDRVFLARLLEGADAVIHTAALHAPHVGAVPDSEFQRINVDATFLVAAMARDAGVRRLVFTSTTALYGAVIGVGACAWIDEEVRPVPRTVYHRTKLAAENILEEMAAPDLSIRILRLSRCFPEPANLMALYRLHRGVDLRDAVEAHVMALRNGGAAFQRYVISAQTPFSREDLPELAIDAPRVIARRAPGLFEDFARRGWALPLGIDRVYASMNAAEDLGWRAEHGFEAVIESLSIGDTDVLPPTSLTGRQTP
ncbi:NAD(P)-dependent oxidoreductase [Pleomorphomonas sp. NRK KF1]|uniref:NAD-dependent epimerase/dehydratase family protein n=1 Tax=Pleomorphomonas sp. NRK KF1 TaxID=2943000 RepID=UPI002043D202|nr:NAD(P)-dependent oxidoreductase [Pleomorphomonas sp. NRK KF1]MCM5555080.1 NAD(P)-dependent oxidoreductase [Pleomorphomonas sp. NRK KF1]